MDIYIDGNALDVTVETEQTVGDLFASLEQWLSDTRFRFTAFKLDGKKVHASEVEKAFSLNLNELTRIDAETASIAQLYAEALLAAAYFLKNRLSADAEKEKVIHEWNESGSRSFLAGNHPGFAKRIDDYILLGKGDGLKLSDEITKRLHEITNPESALLSIKEDIQNITGRLETLSLNMQMGKDREATETVYEFSETAEKLFRIIPFMPAAAIADHRNFFEEFTSVLKEFLEAYKAQDSVLAGDLAEYEVAPRLVELYDRLKEKSSFSGLVKSAETIAEVC
jgi:hypothetical protein